MKKVFQSITLISLLVFSFFLTDKMSAIIKNMDKIMIEIKNNKKKYETKSIDAIINGNTIIPGISKKKVNIGKSYVQMKEFGKYNSDLYVYDYILANISVSKNKNKYIISGNKNKRIVSLIFIIDSIDSLSSIINILNKEKISGAFFINEDFLSNNFELVYGLIENQYIIGINKSSNYKYMNTIINKIGKQKNIYCLYYGSKSINDCMSIDGYTIGGSLIKDNYYYGVSKNISNGSIFIFNGINNLDLIIKYIKKRGYEIVNIDRLINE